MNEGYLLKKGKFVYPKVHTENTRSGTHGPF